MNRVDEWFTTSGLRVEGRDVGGGGATLVYVTLTVFYPSFFLSGRISCQRA